MRTLLSIVTLALSSAALAQADTQEAPSIQPPAPIEQPAPLEQETPPPVERPSEKPSEKPATPTPEPKAETGSACLPIGIGSGLAYGVGALVGGTTLCVGGTLANFSGSSGNTDCIGQCIDALFQAAVITIGIFISIAGLIVLGPAAAIAATVGAVLAATAAEREVWPVVAGGSIGIVTGTIGLALMFSALFDPSPYPFVASEPLDVSRASHIMVVGGLGLVATAGLVSVIGAIAFDATLGGPDESLKPPEPVPAPPAGSTTAMLPTRFAAQAY